MSNGDFEKADYFFLLFDSFSYFCYGGKNVEWYEMTLKSSSAKTFYIFSFLDVEFLFFSFLKFEFDNFSFLNIEFHIFPF